MPILYFSTSATVLGARVFYRYFDNKNKIITLQGLTSEILNAEKNKLEWFIGFTEAEGMFSIINEGNFSFRINLHSDDLISLEYIKNMLSKLANRDIGSIVKSKRVAESYYQIGKFQDIYEILIPIFTKYFMTTSKHLDFSDFKQPAVEIKAKAYLENRPVNNKELSEILELKSNMNTKRRNFDVEMLPKRELTPYRLLGFVEGDGSFTISNKSPEFHIGIHYKNLHFLYEIAEFFSSLPYNPIIGSSSRALAYGFRPKPRVRVTKEVARLDISSILQIFHYILPFFKSLEFKSRKRVDFIYWEIAVKLRALGYLNNPPPLKG